MDFLWRIVTLKAPVGITKKNAMFEEKNISLANCATVTLPLTTTSATTTTLHILCGKPGKMSLRKCNRLFNQKIAF